MSEQQKPESKAPPANRPVVGTNRAYNPFAKVNGSQGDGYTNIIGAEPGWEYVYTPVHDYPADGVALERWRNRLASKGFEPVNGPRYEGATRSEHHPSIPTAEIWRRPESVRDDEWRASLLEHMQKLTYAEQYFRHPGGLPDHVRDAMYAFHGMKHVAHLPRPSVKQLEAMVRKLPVHPGGTKVFRGWD